MASFLNRFFQSNTPGDSHSGPGGRIENNSSSDINSSQFSGYVSNNTSIAVKAGCNPQMEVESCSNCNIGWRGGFLKLWNSKNCNVEGKESQLDVEGCENSNFSGERNKGNFRHNRNLDFNSASDIEVFAEDNTNGNIQGNKSIFKLLRTHNFSVSGNNCSLETSDVKNHNFIGMSNTGGGWGSKEVEHKISFIPNNGSSSTIKVEFCNGAKVIGDNYEIGPFGLNIVTERDRAVIKVPPNTNFQQVSGNLVQFSGEGRDGRTEKLSIQGPQVIPSGRASEFFVNFADNSSI